MELQTAVDEVGVMYDYYSSDKQFQRANEGLVKPTECIMIIIQ